MITVLKFEAPLYLVLSLDKSLAENNCFCHSTVHGSHFSVNLFVHIFMFTGETLGTPPIPTYFVTLISKWTIVGKWVKHIADKRGKVGKIRS